MELEYVRVNASGGGTCTEGTAAEIGEWLSCTSSGVNGRPQMQ